MENDGFGLIYFPLLNYADYNFEPSYEMMRAARAVKRGQMREDTDTNDCEIIQNYTSMCENVQKLARPAHFVHRPRKVLNNSVACAYYSV